MNIWQITPGSKIRWQNISYKSSDITLVIRRGSA
nr:MAG TPA: hypothetical protein [Caudoviricetes sp.]